MTVDTIPAPVTVRAVVHAAGAATAYLRAGRGAPLVLLTEPAWTQPLVHRLATAAWLVVPEVPAVQPEPTDPSGRVAFSRWLQAFLDGLGIERAAFVAGAVQAAAALAFTLLEEDRVERLVLLDVRPLAGDDLDLAERVACPLLRLRATPGSLEALEMAARFLRLAD